MVIALSAALVAGIAPVTAIAAETSSPIDAAALQTAAANSSETATTEKDKAYAAMQEALKNLEAAKEAASPEKIARFNNDPLIMTLPVFKSTATRCWRKPPNRKNPFLPCKRTSMQPKPNTTRPATG